jgi:anti-sigma factor RsiW
MRLRIGLSRDLVCRQAVELVTDYLEGALSRGERRRFEAHLAACPHCTEYLRQMRATISVAGTLEPDDLTPEMQDEFIDLYRRWQSDRAGPDPARPDPPGEHDG